MSNTTISNVIKILSFVGLILLIGFSFVYFIIHSENTKAKVENVKPVIDEEALKEQRNLEMKGVEKSYMTDENQAKAMNALDSLNANKKRNTNSAAYNKTLLQIPD